jgi:hypothetical protein
MPHTSLAAEYRVGARAAVKHEFFHGEIFATAGGTPRHNALCVSKGAELRAVLRSRGCTVLSSDQRLAFQARLATSIQISR